MMTRLDWPGLLRAGLQSLRLRPEEFWRLTPIELKLMLGAEGGGGALTRAGLDQLTAAFPDHIGAGSDDGHSRD
jgi:uncharacterized phage protein (TIGR02216 family)